MSTGPTQALLQVTVIGRGPGNCWCPHRIGFWETEGAGTVRRQGHCTRPHCEGGGVSSFLHALFCLSFTHLPYISLAFPLLLRPSHPPACYCPSTYIFAKIPPSRLPLHPSPPPPLVSLATGHRALQSWGISAPDLEMQRCQRLCLGLNSLLKPNPHPPKRGNASCASGTIQVPGAFYKGVT